MAKSILMPQVGQDLTEGLVIAMNVKVGDSVKKGDIVAEVESEKATFEVEAFEEGTVTDVCFGEGEMAIVLEPLIVLDGADSVGPRQSPPRPRPRMTRQTRKAHRKPPPNRRQSSRRHPASHGLRRWRAG